ncbi:DNA polymerase III, subunit gamma and tau [Candidatus Falkowbacteria bacterium RBG_13_39_14]|uniref:DNA polymerase III subunit gamma/tau n=1 Tax=Candidatus Falkowbacteria bacterium RBG_13_39_14 TaxID=1797985 RepID=A0A1F5S8Q0_9BACT|nr:MAG: DNA polymerase III, subunit gamma and tau [Candidatus Falkowbacteria bacterium RBG_13_39_14]
MRAFQKNNKTKKQKNKKQESLRKIIKIVLLFILKNVCFVVSLFFCFLEDMSVLYQKYRPQKFSEVYGQQHIKVAVQNQIASGKTAHAYLFCGPRAVGKTTIARLLAKAVNCEKRKEGESEPCGECLSCEEIRRGNALDIMEIDAASHTGVDNVRENIIANARVSPSKSKYKVFIIDEVHMLSVSAFNALLKTLEEPPHNVIFILATTEIHKVPGTIISRCQRYDFKKIGVREIAENLNYIASEEGITVDEDVLNNIAIESEGCLRDAQSLLGQILFMGEKHITSQSAEIVIPRSNFSSLADFSELLLNGDIEKSIYFINNLLQEGIDLAIFTKNFVEFLRKAILVKIGSGLDYFSIEFDEGIEKRILKIAENNSIDKIIRAIEFFLEALENLKKCDIAPLPLEMAVLKFTEIKNVRLPDCLPAQAGSIVGKREEGGYGCRDGAPARLRHSGGLPRLGESKEGEEGRDGIEEIKKFPPEADLLQRRISLWLKPLAEEIKKLEIEKPEKQAVGLKIEEVRERWAEVIEGIKKHNHSMCFILKISKPLEIFGNVLKLAHSHGFHQERVQELKNKQNLEEVLKEIFKYDLLVESIIDGSLGKDMSILDGGDGIEGREGEGNKEIGNLTPAIKAGQELKIGETELNRDVDQAGDIKNREQDNNLLQDILSEMGGEVVN